jgi:CBS domain-containing protein
MASTLKAQDFMQKYVLSVPPSTQVRDLIFLFSKRTMTAIPVVGDDNNLLGIISEADLLYKKVRPNIPGYVDDMDDDLYRLGFGHYEKTITKLLDTKASDIMTRDVVCVTPDTKMDTITSLMIDDHLKTVPVVEKIKKGNAPEIHRLVGLISRHDILVAMAARNVIKKLADQ